MNERIGSSDVTVADQTIGEFVASVASNEIPPGGGAAVAVAGATGAALCEMVCNLTIAADGFEDVEAEVSSARDDVATHRERLLELADEDSAAIDDLFDAYAMSEGEGRAESIQRATKRATEVPVETAEACLEVLEHLRMVTIEGKRSALADAGIGAYLAHAALEASAFTARTNLATIEDGEFAGEMEGRVSEVERAGEEALEQIEANLEDDF